TAPQSSEACSAPHAPDLPPKPLLTDQTRAGGDLDDAETHRGTVCGRLITSLCSDLSLEFASRRCFGQRYLPLPETTCISLARALPPNFASGRRGVGTKPDLRNR